MTSQAPPAFLTDPGLSLLYFGGKGGVGKTTCASAAALEIAQRRRAETVLLLSTDPAHSLADALSGLALPPNLEMLELDAAAALERFRQRYRGKLEEIANRGTLLDAQDAQALLEMALPGMDELAAYLEMAEWIEQQRYGCIVVDTAPTGHALRLLQMPDLISRWIKALDALLAKSRYLRWRFQRDQRPDDLDQFLLELEQTRRGIAELVKDGTRCRFVPVTLAEAMSIEETEDLLQMLDGQGIMAQDLVINRMVPASDCAVCRVERQRQLRALATLDRQPVQTRLWALPFLADEPRGEALLNVWPQAQRLDPAELREQGAAVANELPTRVRRPASLPPPSARLVMLAGKGGVGKTTFASATALRLRAEYPDRRILLLSTDPAHSLADCFGRGFGPRPETLDTGLDAEEFAAEQAFAVLQQRYRDELRGFLSQALNNLDITFDREAMEQLLELAPPGLDEIMALTRVIEYLDGGGYDLVVLDTAPSGHTLRLLELPELIQDWLKLFFQLLLKYRSIVKVPELSRDLVELSKSVKRLRALLRDWQETACYLVTIPTALGLAETGDLIAALERLQIRVSGLFINQLTPFDGDCPLCAALHERQALEVAHAQERFPRLEQSLVYRQSAPTGLDALRRLGDALYRPLEGAP